MTDDEMQSGEIKRGFARIERAIAELREEVRERHHKLSNDVSAVVAPVAVLRIQQDGTDRRIEKIEKDMEEVQKSSARISGGFALLAVISSFVPWPWKTP